MRRPDWAPETIDIDRPSTARMYDYFLGGSHNFAVDRAAAQALISSVPETPLIAQANRAFLRRSVRFLVESGIRQFLDLGSGIPTVGNVHEIAQAAAPESTVVYVDIDPVAVAHSREILCGNERAAAIQADVRDPDRILDHPDVLKLIDFGQPVALMIVAVMHFVDDEDRPTEIISRLRSALAPGSFLVLSQASGDERSSADWDKAIAVYDRTDRPLYNRGRDEIIHLFDGFALVEPGVVWVPEWRPDGPHAFDEAEQAIYIGGVGRLG